MSHHYFGDPMMHDTTYDTTYYTTYDNTYDNIYDTSTMASLST
jgi:hypothetical protein